ncbi:hypothetical protein NKH52_29495 [Mesorhizobium sp. M1066]|uniref:cyanophycin synthetase family protein n=1 Tax=unclassified Mesorhizobium TaxID=325217 RepID=UPI00333D1D0B
MNINGSSKICLPQHSGMRNVPPRFDFGVFETASLKNAASGVSSRSRRGWPAKSLPLSPSFDADYLAIPKINKCYFELLFRSSAKINSSNKPELTDPTLVAGLIGDISMLANELSLDAMQRTIRVLDVRVFRGPHLYSLTPMVQIQIDLGALEGFPTDKLPGFTENLGRLLPGLAAHGCSYGAAGGFLRRMEEGTWLGHVVEHVALELQTVVGHGVTRGKTRSVKGSPAPTT